MKVNLTYIVLCIMLLSLLFCACSTDSTDNVAEGGEPVLVTFSLDVQSQHTTRVTDNTWGGNYSVAGDEGFESRIDKSSLVILAYKTDGTFVTDLPILFSTEEDGVVSFTCAVPESLPYGVGKSYRFMVLANCTSKNYGISYTKGAPDLESLVFTAPLTTTIPMWGVKSFELDNTKAEENVFKLGKIGMLRAAAKIGVKLHKDVINEGYSIEGLKLNYANANGYSVPKGWNEETTTENLGRSYVFRPNTTAGIDGLIKNISDIKLDEKSGVYYFYVPETENCSELFTPNEGQPQDLSIAVMLKKKDGDTEEIIEFPYENGIRFCNYSSSGQPTEDFYDIVRNHYYDYTITGISIGLKMTLNVAEWKKEDEWKLDFSAPIHTKLLTSAKLDADAPTQEPTVTYNNNDILDENSNFVGYFMMESPEGSAWKPTLANASTNDYEVRVYTTDGINPEYNVLVTDNQIEATRNKFYKIVVIAKNPNNVGNVIKLGLTHTANWNDEANPLLIINKGDNNDCYYPWTSNPNKPGDDPDIHWISIRQK